MKTKYNVKLLNGSKQEVTYEGVETVTLPDADSDGVKQFTAGEPLDDFTVTPDFSEGDQTVEAPEGTVIRSGTITKPEGAEAVIAKGKALMGMTGEYVTPGTSKTVELDFSAAGGETVVLEETTAEFSYVEDEGMSIAAVESDTLFSSLVDGEAYTVNWDGEAYTCEADVESSGALLGNGEAFGLPGNGEPFAFEVLDAGANIYCFTDTSDTSHTFSITHGSPAVQTITAEGDERWNEVVINKPENLAPENIAKDVEIAGVVGTARTPEDPLFEENTDGLEDVRFYDIDGTIVYRCSVEEAELLTELPVPPAHDGFQFQEWNHTLAEVVELRHPLDIGANYTTADKKTVLTVYVSQYTSVPTSGTVTMTFYQSVDSGVAISVDGATAATVSGTGTVSISIGTFSVASGTSKEISFEPVDDCEFYVVEFSSISYNSNLSFTPIIGNAKIGDGYDLSNTMLLYNVENIPVGMTTITNSAKIGATFFPIPRTVTDISNRPHYSRCDMLSLPRNVNVTYTSIAGYVYSDRLIFPESLSVTPALYSSYSKYVWLPDGLTSVIVAGNELLKLRFPEQPFTLTRVEGTRMAKFTVPANAIVETNVSSPSSSNSLFYNCYSLREIAFEECAISNPALNKTIAYICPKLKALKFPPGITSIEKYIANHSRPETLFIPEGVTSVDLSSFFVTTVDSASQTIELIVLPSTLTTLNGTFSPGSRLPCLRAIVYLSAESPPLKFYGTDATWNCYVKDEIVDSMKETYATYNRRIKPLSELPGSVKDLINKEYGGII